jgi:hypothetical protein
VNAPRPLAADEAITNLARAARRAGVELTPELREKVGSVAANRVRGRGPKGVLVGLRAWIAPLGRARWGRNNPSLQASVLSLVFDKALAGRFSRIYAALESESPRITRYVDLDFLRELVVKFKDRNARTLTSAQAQALLEKAASVAAEGSVLHHPRLLAIVDEEIADVSRLARDGTFLERHGLASIASTPLVFSDVRTSGRAGPKTARLPYVDLALLFEGRAKDGSPRYVVKLRGQVKLAMADTLVSRLNPDGEYRVGQMANDELRKSRGPWYFRRVRMDQSMLIQDPRHTRLVTAASRELTAEEARKLRLVDGLSVEHLVHDVSYEEFYNWAKRLVRELGIVVED